MFPHHHQVPLYFAKHIYADFVLDMHLDYTSTPLTFYGAGGGRSHACPGARRYHGAQREPDPLVGLPTRTMLRKYDVADSSQLVTEERSALEEVTHMEMHGTMMVVHAERCRAPTPPVEPELQWVANDVCNIFYHNMMMQYVIMARDAYFGLHHRCRPRLMG